MLIFTMSLWREICVRLDKYYFAHDMPVWKWDAVTDYSQGRLDRLPPFSIVHILSCTNTHISSHSREEPPFLPSFLLVACSKMNFSLSLGFSPMVELVPTSVFFYSYIGFLFKAQIWTWSFKDTSIIHL